MLFRKRKKKKKASYMKVVINYSKQISALRTVQF